MSLTHDECIDEYKPGSIRRIKLQNFLTYTKVEFVCGPRLNVVAGPNGTGKSTILCAICLGLGGEPKLLGRADDARHFITHEMDKAFVEIELAPKPNGKVHVFKRVIDASKGSESGRGKGASTFFVNGEKKSAKEVRRIVAEVYHISVDNMCTFLPQDRVGSFSGFNPQELLVETEKSLSASKQLYETHLELISIEEELRKGGNETETIEAKLQALEAENERLEREKERMEEREQALEQMDLLRKKMLWLRFDDARARAMQLKEEKLDAKEKAHKAQEVLGPLEVKCDELEAKEKRMKARFQSLDKDAKKADREMQKRKQKAETHLDDIEGILSELASADAQQRNAERQVEHQRIKVETIEEQLKELPSEDEVKQAMHEAQQEMRAYKPERDHARQEMTKLKSKYKDLEENARRAHGRLARVNDERAVRRERIFRTNDKLHQVYQWVEANRKNFRRPVWGPIMIEVNPKNKNAAAFLEQHVPNHALKAFVVECKEDSNRLYREVREKLKLPVNIIEVNQGRLQPLTRMYSDEKMRILKEEHGVHGYMDESFDAPPAVVQALCQQASVEKVLVGSEVTQKSIDRKGLLDYLSEREDGRPGLQGCCIFTNQGDRSYKYTSSISRYSGKPSVRVDDINPARSMAPGVNPAQKEKMEKDLDAVKQQMEQMTPDIQNLDRQFQEINVRGQEIQARMKQAKSKQADLTKCRQKLTNAKRKLRDLEEIAATDNEAEKKKLLRKLQKHIESNITALETHAECHAQMMKATHTLAAVKINQDGLSAAVGRAKTVLADKTAEFAEIKQAYDNIVALFNKARDKLRDCKSRADDEAPLRDADGEELPLKALLEELPVSTLEEAEAALEDATARANCIDANPDVLRQYEARKVEIEETRAQLADASTSRDKKLKAIEEKRGPWETALENSAKEVNVLFSKYMEELGCAGEVSLSKGEESPGNNRRGNEEEEGTGNFKKWGIQIKVKFREKSDLQVLSAQVQSGGERSVSTIMYLMALQNLMVSPFRCVDEINQGLDERNERLVFKRIVANSTQPPDRNAGPSSHSGQYFLITPKLLPNMDGMENENVTVLTIYNGPHNMKDPLDWNVAKFIKIAAELSAKRSYDEHESEETDEVDENKSPRSSGKRRKVVEEESEE